MQALDPSTINRGVNRLLADILSPKSILSVTAKSGQNALNEAADLPPVRESERNERFTASDPVAKGNAFEMGARSFRMLARPDA
ncbi:MAG: hypothetical protein MUC83_09815 [Pirellula sp.]|nr:hypothetical protein [Pirellula sp.]